MRKQHVIGYAFISPWLIGFLVFVAGPFVVSIYLSFTRYEVVTSPVWVGLSNTLKYALVAVPVGIVAGVALALLLNLRVAGISVYRTIFYLPAIVPIVATSVVFVWLLNPQIGLVNQLLQALGVAPKNCPAWLDSTRWAFWSLVFMSLWAVGGSMIIYLAGLKDIPVALYEAAVIDGASTWQRTRHITLPMLTPVIFFNLVMGTIGAFQYFTQAYIMTQGGPEDSTHFYALYLFNRAWRYLDMGYASAMAWILFVIVMVLTIIIFKTHRRWVHYGG